MKPTTSATRNPSGKNTIRTQAMTALLAALATVLMFLSFSVPFVPSFIKLELSELPALIAAFSMGPLSGVAVCLVKNLVNLPFTYSSATSSWESASSSRRGSFTKSRRTARAPSSARWPGT